MPSYTVPPSHADGDTGFIAAYNAIAADLGLIAAALPVVEGGAAGATAATRYAGGTSSGSPGSGTFATGDFVIDVSGAIWICTAGGSPGTWAQAGAGGGGAMINPMTTAGDLIKGGAGGTPARLAAGSTGQALIVSGGAPAWGAVGFAGGGTGQATQQAALDAVAGAVTANQVLAGNGTHVTLRALAAADIPQLADYAPTGLTGATTGVRFVGGTTTGAPGSGTFATGDFVITQDGHVFICTSGGSPGTWVNAASGLTNPMTTLGDIISGGASGTPARLAGNTTSTKEFLTSTGSGGVAAAPAWGAIAAGDVPTLNQNTTGTAGGLSSTLAVGSGGTGQTSAQAAMDALAGAVTSAQYLRGNGSHVVMAAIQAADVPTLNQNTSGSSGSCTGNAATATNLAGGATLPAYLAPKAVTLTFVGSGTTLVDASLGNAFNLTLTASTTTLGAPSNPVDGQVIRFRITQGSGGSFTLSYASAYDFGAAGAPTLSTTAGKVDILGFEYVASISKWCYVGSGLGY